MAHAASAHLKRALRDALAQWPAGEHIVLMGPPGVGKRTLAQKLTHLTVHTTDHRSTETATSRRLVRLHPFGVKELGLKDPKSFKGLLARGGFPANIWGHGSVDEPTSRFFALWAPSQAPKALAPLLAQSIGQTLTTHRLAQSLGVANRTVARWLDWMEAHWRLFFIPPLKSPTAGQKFRALKKDRKHYPLDWSYAPNQQAQTEALVAVHLLAWVHAHQDLLAKQLSLHYFRDCDQREVDFVVLDQDEPKLLIQCEPNITQISKDLRYLHKKFPNAQAWQLSLDAPQTPQNIQGIHLAHPLALLWQLPDVHGLAQ